jgi:D-glycero-D-manno-heptose 1,7-bisphosphate phosphatase
MPGSAVFLNRDSTLIEHNECVSCPAQVRLVAGVAEALIKLRGAGFKLVVVTNRSEVARGELTEGEVEEVHEEMKVQLTRAGGAVDGVYYCPYLDGPKAVVEPYRRDSPLRKPKPGMLLRAAHELGIDLKNSWMIGAMVRDIQAAHSAGCRAVLLGDASSRDLAVQPDHFAGTLEQAANWVIEQQKKETRMTTSPEPNKRSTEIDPAVVEEIRDMLRQKQRLAERDDFSLPQLAGAAAQFCAIAFAFWALLDMTTPDLSHVAAVRFLAAIFAQVVAHTMFSLGRSRGSK